MRGRFSLGAFRGKRQCVARWEPRDPSTACIRWEMWTVLVPRERLAVANMQTHTCVRCKWNAGIVSLGLPLNISKGQERNTKGKWISESGAAVPYGMPKEPPFPSYNRNKSVWSLPLTLLLWSATNLHPSPSQPCKGCGGMQRRRDK